MSQIETINKVVFDYVNDPGSIRKMNTLIALKAQNPVSFKTELSKAMTASDSIFPKLSESEKQEKIALLKSVLG